MTEHKPQEAKLLYEDGLRWYFIDSLHFGLGVTDTSSIAKYLGLDTATTEKAIRWLEDMEQITPKRVTLKCSSHIWRIWDRSALYQINEYARKVALREHEERQKQLDLLFLLNTAL